MALQTSGAISLNDIHIEAGGSSGTQASINDADIRGLIGKGSGVQMSFSEWYGASNVVQYSAPIVIAQTTFIKATYYGFFANPSPNFLFNPMGTLNGSTGQWSFGGFGITSITTQTDTVSSNTYLTIWGTLTNTNFTSISYPSGTGTVTVPASSFTNNTGQIQFNNVQTLTSGSGHIQNGTITVTV